MAVLVASTAMAVQEPAELDLAKLKTLPVRFNGRLAELGQVANSCADRLGGSREFQGPDGKVYDALTWYLYAISGHPDFDGIVAVRVDKSVAQFLELTVAENSRYAFGQVADQFSKLGKEYERVAEMPYVDRTQRDHELVRLRNELMFLIENTSSHRSPWRMEKERIFQEIQRMDSYESLSVPMMVTPNDTKSGRWQVLFAAAVRELARNDAGIESIDGSPYARHLCHLLATIAADDGEAFDSSLQNVNEALDATDWKKNAMQFSVPPSWVEQGQSNVFEPAYYSDAFAMGLGMSKLTSSSDPESDMITINHFPGQKIDPHMLGNSWRLMEGVPPMSEAQFIERVSRSSVHGSPGWMMDVETPTSVPKRRTRTRAVIIHHPSGTWTVSIHGTPESIAGRLPEFEKFLDSLVLPESVSQWVGVSEVKDSEDVTQRVRLLVKPDESVDWWVRILGTEQEIEQAREEVIGEIRKLAQTAPARGSGSTKEEPDTEAITDWKAPDHWRAWTEPQMSDTQKHHRLYFLGNRDQPGDGVVISVMAIQKLDQSQLIALANYMRQSMHWRPVPALQWKTDLKLPVQGELIEIPIEN